MSASQQECVDVGVDDWGKKTFRKDCDLVPGDLTALDKLDETGARSTHEIDRHTGCSDAAHVGTRRDRADGADHSYPAGRRRRDKRFRSRCDHVDHRNVDLGAKVVKPGGSRRVTSHDDRLRTEVSNEAASKLARIAAHVW